MRHFVMSCVLVLFVGQAQAQSPLTDPFQLLIPGLTVSVFRDLGTGLHACNTTAGVNGITYAPLNYGSAFYCEPLRQGFVSIGAAFDAAGAFYQIAPNNQLGTTDVVRGTEFSTEIVARLPNPAAIWNLAVDSTNGRLYLAVATIDPTFGWEVDGIIVISGLPQMFDVLNSFLPGGQSLVVITPAHPDGFRSADSLQVWTGDLRSLPDWSQAQPLTCDAATSPTPGQLVTVADTLPDPVGGEGRYYLTASQNGTERRLGRQYIAGSFSARNPSSLPVCQ